MNAANLGKRGESDETREDGTAAPNLRTVTGVADSASRGTPGGSVFFSAVEGRVEYPAHDKEARETSLREFVALVEAKIRRDFAYADSLLVDGDGAPVLKGKRPGRGSR